MKTIATFNAHKIDDTNTSTVINILESFDGNICADSNDLGMGHSFDIKSRTKRGLAAELAHRHGYMLTEDAAPVMIARFIGKREVQKMIKALRDAGLVVNKTASGYECSKDKTLLFMAMNGNHNYLVRMRADLFTN